MRVVALISGGLDSTVATWALAREHEIALGLTFDYGQRAAQREREAAQAICRQLGCAHLLLELEWLGQLGHNALTDVARILPTPSIELLDDAVLSEQTAQAVWVPNRNGVFINVAAAVCEALDCRLVAVGFNSEEGASFPDNTPEFVAAANGALAYSTQAGVRVVSPTANLTKAEIVKLGMSIGVPFDLVWSCYEGADRHCMHCESCLRLQRALQSGGIWQEWKRKHETARGDLN